MNIVDLRKIDLNLLVVFHILMQERHVTRTAKSLHLSQSAVSAALGRLRVLLDDPLFERGREGMNPTARAFEISGQVALALGSLAKAFHPEESFSPRLSSRTFHLAMSDDIASVIGPWLLKKSNQQHWGVKFALHQTTSLLHQTALSSEQIDAVVCSTPHEVAAEFKSKQLFAGSYSCLYSTRHRTNRGNISEADFRAADHIRVSFDGQRGFMDDLLEASGIHRHVPLSVSHFSAIPVILHEGPAIATIPDFAAEQFAKHAELGVSPVPVPVPRFTTSIIWRVASEGSPETQWLINTLSEFPSA
ncbi:LysR family transcriptional regulator [Leucobacter sp. HY1908]